MRAKREVKTDFIRPIFLSTASLIVLIADVGTPAYGQASLPAVTVEAPKQQPRPRSRATAAGVGAHRNTRRSTARTTAARAVPAPAARNALSVSDRLYPGTQGYVANTSSVASKTDTPLIETPRSVTVIDRKELDDRAVNNVVDAVRYTAGATTEAYGFDPRFDEIQLRGFPVVTFGDFRDGLKQLPANFGTWRTEPYQLDNIQVIKGPAAVLYGQTVPGGLIDRISKLPVDNQVNEIALQGGTSSRAQVAFDIGRASQDKSLLWRLVGVGRDGDTNFDIADKRLLLAPSVTWRPTIDTTITAYAILQKDETDTSVSVVNNNGALPVLNGQTLKLRASDPAYDFMKIEQAQIGYKLEHRFDNVFTFRQNTRFGAYRENSRYLDGSFDDPANPTVFNRAPWSVHDDLKTWQTDNMLQADFATGPVIHKALFGVNYDYSVWNYAYGYGDEDPAYALDIANPRYGIAGPTAPYVDGLHSTQDQIGLYAQDQMKLGGWNLSISGRQDWANRNQIDTFTADQQGRRDSAFSYSAALMYRFDSGIAPYVSYATSFQPRTELGISNSVLAPSTGKQIEVGVKYQPRPDILLTASAYDLRETNAAVIAGYLGAIPYYESVGETRVQGFEFEARARITPELETVTAYTYTDAKITGSDDPLELGNTPAVTPRNTASSWLNYTFRQGALEGLSLGGGVRYVGGSWTDSYNASRNAAYTMVDLATRYDLAALGRVFKGYQASINVNNVANDEVTVCNTGFCYLTQGRSVIGTLRYRW